MTDTSTRTSGSNTTPLSASSIREVEETVARISSHKGVEGVMIMNCQGAILQSTWKEEERLAHASMILQLTKTATLFMKSIEHGTSASKASSSAAGKGGRASGAAGKGGLDSSNHGGAEIDIVEAATSTKVEDLSFLRIRSKKHEIMVAPDKDYLLVVLTNPNATMEKI
mmetsp:Transcript_27791/g.39066  ORF Transcript_27791/g.39066 Transcript_27791/m.39066 type:complete len:169 (-) Transcript_27791:91-597(-)